MDVDVQVITVIAKKAILSVCQFVNAEEELFLWSDVPLCLCRGAPEKCYR